MPAIIDPSPYYTSLGRGNETQYIHTTAAGVLDKFPLFYDNFFVPRGYAVHRRAGDRHRVLDRLPAARRPRRRAGFKAVIDWLRGRVPGYTTMDGTTPVTASWDNGKNAMIGKSYDGTFANGVASTGVEGPHHDRPDLGDLGLVRLLADGWDPVQHPLSGVPLQRDHAEPERHAPSASLRQAGMRSARRRERR